MGVDSFPMGIEGLYTASFELAILNILINEFVRGIETVLWVNKGIPRTRILFMYILRLSILGVPFGIILLKRDIFLGLVLEIFFAINLIFLTPFFLLRQF
jgi:hypothetical protein